MPGAYALPEAGSLFFLSFWASGRPNSPFSQRGEGGWGDEGQMDTGTSLPLSALAPPHAGQGDTLDEETL